MCGIECVLISSDPKSLAICLPLRRKAYYTSTLIVVFSFLAIMVAGIVVR